MNRHGTVCFRILVGIVAVCSGVYGTLAQEQTPTPADVGVKSAAAENSGSRNIPKQISGGVLNGRARELPKPVYPPAAAAVGASGAVNVQVLIDTEGHVDSATAVSGHPLLRAAAVEAARNSKFAPTFLSGNPVKVSGIIVYNFVGPLSFGALGYDLAFAERSGAFAPYTNPTMMSSQLPEDWVTEKNALISLENAKPAETPQNDPPKMKSTETNKFTVIGDTAPGSVNHSAASSSGTAAGRKLTEESVGTIRSLRSDIENRLITDPRSQWHFKLGARLGQLTAEIEDDNKTAINVGELEQLVGTAPQNVSQQAIARVKELIELYRAARPGPDLRQRILAEAQMLRTIRI